MTLEFFSKFPELKLDKKLFSALHNFLSKRQFSISCTVSGLLSLEPYFKEAMKVDSCG